MSVLLDNAYLDKGILGAAGSSAHLEEEEAEKNTSAKTKLNKKLSVLNGRENCFLVANFD